MFFKKICVFISHIIPYYTMRNPEIPNKTIPAVKNARLINCFLDSCSFKNIRASTMVTTKYIDVTGAVSTGLIDAAKINAIVPAVSLVAAPQRSNSSS